MIRTAKPLRQAALALGVTMMLAGCAGPNPRDPYEGFNRAMFSFNDTVDTYALKPVATVYKNVTPSFVQTGVSNFFGNLGDAWTAVNQFLQGNGEAGMSDLSRFALNSTLGIVGLFDIASEAGLPKHKEDFGQTLGVWGVQSGPYLMLPLLGPSTVRDTAALPLDIAGDIWRYKEPVYIRNIGTGLRVVDQRAALLDASSLLEDAALDRYEFIRDGFLQRRESQIHPDGDGPMRKPAKDDDMETSAPVSSESATKELNSGTPAAKPDSQ
ncbi:phospholipid-binding lipoprotein MlaA [Duganella sacchari]|uniref:Phospholipid-binding lipoprotein MlaA n=1 Tax=Duganella sacchari TaxID=551987 RepID=A0A1M7MSK7_9BURK|nr:VacJ family lipoprotein [Duganella sacchari]SHM93937.1 phospholipid-binding lipoprotein MlaA [Duganella sacchari]